MYKHISELVEEKIMQVAPYNYLAVKPYGLHRRNQSIKYII